jgi:hypothetical protein
MGKPVLGTVWVLTKVRPAVRESSLTSAKLLESCAKAL